MALLWKSAKIKSNSFIFEKSWNNSSEWLSTSKDRPFNTSSTSFFSWFFKFSIVLYISLASAGSIKNVEPDADWSCTIPLNWFYTVS